MNVKYFSWIKENIKKDSEVVSFQNCNILDLLENLRLLGKDYDYVFSKPEKFCVAVNDKIIQKNCYKSTLVTNNDTVGFFPPISGG